MMLLILWGMAWAWTRCDACDVQYEKQWSKANRVLVQFVSAFDLKVAIESQSQSNNVTVELGLQRRDPHFQRLLARNYEL